MSKEMAEVSKEESPTSVLQQNPFDSIVDAPVSHNAPQVCNSEQEAWPWVRVCLCGCVRVCVCACVCADVCVCVCVFVSE